MDPRRRQAGGGGPLPSASLSTSTEYGGPTEYCYSAYLVYEYYGLVVHTMSTKTDDDGFALPWPSFQWHCVASAWLFIIIILLLFYILLSVTNQPKTCHRPWPPRVSCESGAGQK